MASELTPEQHAAIDAAVATRIFNLRKYDAFLQPSGWCNPHNGMEEKPHDWSPSTDIAAAWEVVLWLRERWGQFSLVAGLGWHCYASENQPDYPEKMGSADTAPLAICLAALKAVGVNTKEWEG